MLAFFYAKGMPEPSKQVGTRVVEGATDVISQVLKSPKTFYQSTPKHCARGERGFLTNLQSLG